MLANVGAKYKGGKRPCFDSMSNEYLTCYCDIKIFSFFFIHNVVTSLFCCCCFGMEVPFAFELSQQEPQTHEIRHSTSTNSRHSDSSTSPFKKKKKIKKQYGKSAVDEDRRATCVKTMQAQVSIEKLKWKSTRRGLFLSIKHIHIHTHIRIQFHTLVARFLHFEYA